MNFFESFLQATAVVVAIFLIIVVVRVFVSLRNTKKYSPKLDVFEDSYNNRAEFNPYQLTRVTETQILSRATAWYLRALAPELIILEEEICSLEGVIYCKVRKHSDTYYVWEDNIPDEDKRFITNLVEFIQANA